MRAMKISKLLILFSLSCLAVVACDSPADEMERSANRLAEALEKSTDTLALSVPGEEYRRMIEIARTGSDEDRQLLVAQWSRLAGFNVEEDFEVRIRATYNEAASIPFELNAKYMRIPGQPLAEAACNEGVPAHYFRIENAGVRPARNDEIIGRLAIAIEDVLEGLAGPAVRDNEESRSALQHNGNEYIKFAGQPPVWPGNEYYSSFKSSGRYQVVENRRAIAAQQLAPAIHAAISGFTVDQGLSSISLPYSPIRNHQYLLIIIPNDVLDNHETFELHIEVVSANDEDTQLAGAPRQSISHKNYAAVRERSSFVCGNPPRTVSWVAVDLRNDAFISPQTVQALAEAATLKREYEKVLAEIERSRLRARQ